MGHVVAPDRLPARSSKPYVRDKLEWLDEYLRAALTATKTMLGRNYLDLFAGPGGSVIEGSSMFVEAGGLRAVRAMGSDRRGFDRGIFVNLDPVDDSTIRARVMAIPPSERAIPDSGMQFVGGDSNHLVRDLLKDIPPRDYIFAFLDPEHAGQLPWTTIEALKAQGHQSIDLYMLFPWGMDIRRNMRDSPDRYDAFFGDRSWRSVLDGHPSDSQRFELSRALRAHYLARLKRHWAYATEVLQVNLRGDQNLYWMLFASSNIAGKKIAEGVSKAMSKRTPQLNLLS